MSKLSLGMLSAFWPEGVFRYAGVPLHTVVEACVRRPASSWRSAVALVGPHGASLTYQELLREVERAAAALRVYLAPGQRVAIALSSAVEEVVWLLAATEAGAIVCLGGTGAEVVISPQPLPGKTTLSPSALLSKVEEQAPAARPDLRSPRLVLPSVHGEALYSHRNLVAAALSWAAFFELADDVKVALALPPSDWLSVTALLAILTKGGTAYLAWGPSTEAADVDYLVAPWWALEEGRADIWRGHVRVGVLAGIEGWFSPWRRRRLSSTLRAPLLTVLGRNDLGPVLASHPEWFLWEAVGIHISNVDTRPLDPADGHPLPLGWDVIEVAEMGVKSPMVPEGAETVQEGWARTRLMAAIDPSGLFFLRGRL
jgi:hypothetical protein